MKAVKEVEEMFKDLPEIIIKRKDGFEVIIDEEPGERMLKKLDELNKKANQ
jgi:hypothetical protein